jgi:Flp pilus assembly protein TadG
VHKLKSQRGQALVEFALILPLLLTLVLGIFDFGTAYNYQNDMSQLANEAARYAAVQGCNGCAPGNPNTEIPAIVKADADTGALRDPTHGVTICLFWPAGSTGAKGDAVKVLVEKNYSWVPYLHLSKTKITASATMRMESAYDPAKSPWTPDTLTGGGNCSAYDPSS